MPKSCFQKATKIVGMQNSALIISAVQFAECFSKLHLDKEFQLCSCDFTEAN